MMVPYFTEISRALWFKVEIQQELVKEALVFGGKSSMTRYASLSRYCEFFLHSGNKRPNFDSF